MVKKKENIKKVVAINNSKTLIAHDWWATNTPRLSPPRGGNDVEFFICGEDYFKKLAGELEQATHEILITDWVLNPEVYLVREGKLKEENKLISILTRAAKRGVMVRIMLYDSQDWFGIDLDDDNTEDVLEKAHTNIRVHRYRHASYYSPHQKTVVIDTGIAYIGGIDLAFGRWDNSKHNLFADPEIFLNDIYDGTGTPFNINTQPRMPWQDVQARIKGPSAVDIQTNFTQRWAFQRTSGRNKPELTIPTRAIKDSGKHRVQIIRSIGSGSINQPGTETSIVEVYLKAIEGAKHFIYIENQFFTSNFGTSKVQNQIANTIVRRILRAIDKSEIFRVYIVLPVHPEGSIPNDITYELMYWQYQTILRSGANSFLGLIRAKLGKDDVSEYVNFFCLRNYGLVKSYLSEQIYVHTKLMIVDDNVTILGSANINDRSFLGNRDNEICGIFMDTESKKIKINNKDTLVRNSAHNLRVQLWENHLGNKYKGKVTDPTSKKTLDTLLNVAKKNTEAFEKIFPNIPSNRFQTYVPQGTTPSIIQNNMTQDEIGTYLKKNIEGFLTFFPLNWLLNEDLESFTQPDEIFVENNKRNTTHDIA